MTPEQLRALALAAMREAAGPTTPASHIPDPAPRNSIDPSFERLVDHVVRGGEMPRGIAIGETPAVFQALGAPKLTLTISEDTIWKAIDKHGLTPTEIKSAIRRLDAPLMVFDSATTPGSLVALVDVTDRKGRPIVAAVHIGRKSGRITTNVIASIHGKEGAGFIRQWIDAGLLRYVDERGVDGWTSTRGLQLPKVVYRGQAAYGTSQRRPHRKILKPADVFKDGPGPKFSIAAEGAEGVSRAARDAVQKRFAGELRGRFTDLQPAVLAAVPLNYFSELKRPNMAAVDDYLRLKRAMDTYRGRKHDAADKVAQDWYRYARLGLDKDGKAKAAELADLMHEATLAGVDPSRSPQDFGDVAPPEAYGPLRKRFLALPPKGRELFETVRDAYKAQAEELDRIIMDNVRQSMEIAAREAEKRYRAELDRIKRDGKLSNIEKADAINEAKKRRAAETTKSEWAKKARLTRLRQAFESSRVPSPYFPLARFGRYFVAVKDVDGSVLSFSRFERAADRDRAAEDLRARAGRDFPGAAVEAGVLDNTSELRQAMDPRVIAQIETLLGNAGVDDAVMDAIWQRYLQTMPDLSMRKRQIHRKGTPGFERDALRVFASHMFHAAHQMARLKYGLGLQEAVNQAAEQARASDDPTRGTTLVNELRQRHKWVMNPTGSKAVQAVTSTMFTWYLAATPAAAIVNLTQTPMLGIPILGARLGGAGKASAAILRAAKDFAAGAGDVRRANLSPEERSALDAFYDSGLIDRTQSHELAGVGDVGVEYSPLRAKVMGAISWVFHRAEVANREVTALAAYRMARARGQDQIAAVNTAHELTWKAHFDYSNSNRARFMQGDAMKLITVFQNYQLNMWYRLFRDFHQAFKGETPQARREARYQLAGVMGMMTLMGGVTGLFGYNVLMALAGALLDDPDDPRDFKAEMEGNVVKLFGPDIGGMILKGVPGHLLNIDLTSRIGMPDFFIRAPDDNAEGKDWYMAAIIGALGVVPATIVKMGDGLSLIGQGKTMRGLELMAPKAIRDAMQAYRYANDGLTTRRGDAIMEPGQMGAWDVIAKAIGFTSARIAETYERNARLKNAERHVLDERRELVNRWAAARLMGDDEGRREALAAIRRWNARPYAKGVRITQETLQRSIQTRKRNASRREDGVLIQNKALGRYLRDLQPARMH